MAVDKTPGLKAIQDLTDAGYRVISDVELANIITASDEAYDRFAFVLGAGASFSSGIPMAGELALKMLRELHWRRTNKHAPDEEVLSWYGGGSAKIADPTPDNLAAGYAGIYSATYGFLPQVGYAFLYQEMKDRKPSFGYSILARILVKTAHNVVITPNFDNLVEQALVFYQHETAIVCGHHTLARRNYRPLPRPMVVKFHHDLMLDPISDSGEMQQLDGGYAAAVRGIMTQHALVFIGYGGNDPDFTRFLDSLKPEELISPPFFCFLAKFGQPTKGILDFVRKTNGVLVAIDGFDELMTLIMNSYEWEPYNEEYFLGSGRGIWDEYRKNMETVMGDPGSAAAGALEKSVTSPSGQKPWWIYQSEINTETDDDAKERLYRAALNETDSPELRNNFALFLQDSRGKYEEAQALYQSILKEQPKEPDYLGNYAVLLHKYLQDYDAAEDYYRRAIDQNPQHANNMGNFALFMHEVRHEMDVAEGLYKRAIELDPNQVNQLGNYALFLQDVRLNANRAEELYKKAIQLDPRHEGNLGNYAHFLQDVREDMDRAEAMHKRAMEVNPLNINNLANYAGFLFARGHQKEAMARLAQARKLAAPDNYPLRLECDFYELLHGPAKNRKALLSAIKEKLNAGYRSLGWSFKTNLQKAKKDRRPELAWLQKLADVIAGNTDIAALKAWNAWNDA